MIPGLFQQALGQGVVDALRRDEEHLIKGAVAHAGHGLFVLLLLIRGQTGLQRGEERLGAFFLGQADDGAQMAHLGHIEDAEQGHGLLRGAAGVQNDERALRQHPDAAAVLDGSKAFEDCFVRDVEALFAESQRRLDCNGRTARRMTAQKGQRHGVAAVIHPAREFFGFEEGDVVRVRHDQFTVLAASRHDELTQRGLGLLRCGDADGTFPHDARSQSRRTLHRAAHAVRADGGHHADRHVGERFGQTGIRQLHHSQLAAGTECRIPAQHHTACHRRLHQKLF